MHSINIDGTKMSYEIIDNITDKIIVIKAPRFYIADYNSQMNKIAKYFKEKHNAVDVIFLASDVDLETMGDDIAIKYIDSYIEKLNAVKNNLINKKVE